MAGATGESEQSMRLDLCKDTDFGGLRFPLLYPDTAVWAPVDHDCATPHCAAGHEGRHCPRCGLIVSPPCTRAFVGVANPDRDPSTGKNVWLREALGHEDEPRTLCLTCTYLVQEKKRPLVGVGPSTDEDTPPAAQSSEVADSDGMGGLLRDPSFLAAIGSAAAQFMRASGTAIGGDRGTAHSGDQGTTRGGDRGTTRGGDQGTAQSGDRGTARGGDLAARGRGTATRAGDPVPDDIGDMLRQYETATVPSHLPVSGEQFDLRRVATWVEYLPHAHLRAEIYNRLHQRYGDGLPDSVKQCSTLQKRMLDAWRLVQALWDHDGKAPMAAFHRVLVTLEAGRMHGRHASYKVGQAMADRYQLFLENTKWDDFTGTLLRSCLRAVQAQADEAEKATAKDKGDAEKARNDQRRRDRKDRERDTGSGREGRDRDFRGGGRKSWK